MLISAEHEFFSAHKFKNANNLTFMSRKNSILGLAEPEKKTELLDFSKTYRHLKSHAYLSWAQKKFITPGPLQFWDIWGNYRRYSKFGIFCGSIQEDGEQ